MKMPTAYGEQITRQLDGRFQDVRLLHTGENGVVFSARDPADADARRALRVPFPDDGADEAHTVRFHRLAELARAVQHPHVAACLALEQVAGMDVAIMELAGPLRVDHLITSTKPATVHRILTVMRELATALDALHAAGIVHGALRPSRVLLDASGHVKVTGMLLRSGEAAPHTALTPAHVGDPAYMAPEQWHSATAAAAMDVYAAGVIAFELYTGEPRVTRLAPGVAIHPVVIPANRSLRPDLPVAINAALRRATHPDPAMRFATVGAFVDALAAPHTPTAGHPAIGPPSEAARQPAPSIGLRVVLLLAALVVVLVMLLL